MGASGGGGGSGGDAGWYRSSQSGAKVLMTSMEGDVGRELGIVVGFKRVECHCGGDSGMRCLGWRWERGMRRDASVWEGANTRKADHAR